MQKFLDKILINNDYAFFNATYCLSILAQIFDDEHSISKLENFVSINGANHYNLNSN